MGSSTAQIATAVVLLIAVFAVKAQEIVSIQKPHAGADPVTKELKFKVDTAKLTVSVNTTDGSGKLSSPLSIYLKSDYCHDCSYYSVANISGTHHHSNKTFLIDTRWGSSLLFVSPDCYSTKWYHYGERGEYKIVVTINSTNGSCTLGDVQILTEPINSYTPILVAFCILLLIAILYTTIDQMWTCKTPERSESVERFINSQDLGGVVPCSPQDDLPLPEPKPGRERHKAIDSFRGLCIVIMIFVNFKGGRYWFFHHSPWHGLTVADLVFPWFMFIMGINIVLSVDSQIRKATSNLLIGYKIARRTLILFFLGLCIINHNTDFTHMRVPGVLQRFAIAYFVVAMLQWAFHKPVPDMVSIVVMSSEDGNNAWWYHVRDIVVYWPQWKIIFAFETLWTCLTFLLEVPGCPKGYLGPGGLADHGMFFNCTGGAAGYIDRKVFGVAHIYGHATAKPIYFPTYSNEDTVPFDPEGLLGTIHSILIVFLGLQAGKIFLYYKEPKQRMIRWFAWSLFLGVISAILTKCSQFDGWIPVNKNLWSTSFVTTLACMAFFILPVMYYVIDIKKWWTGVPFYYIGMNSILIYVGHEVFQDFIPFSWGLGATSTHAVLLTMNMVGVGLWVIIAYYCYKIEFFVKI